MRRCVVLHLHARLEVINLLRYIDGRHPADLGSAPGPPKPGHPAIHPRPERPLGDGVPAALRAGVEPRGVHLGPLQAPRTPQRLRQESLGFERRRPSLIEADAAPASPDYRILGTGFFIRLTPLYYTGFSNLRTDKMS